MQNNKIIFLDIGTHEAQELRVLTIDKTYLLKQYSTWWFDWIKRLVKIIIRHKGRVTYDKGAYIISPFRFKGHLGIIKLLFSRNYLKRIHVLSIDPLINITNKYINKLKRKINIQYLPVVVLPHIHEHSKSIIPFYQTENSLSSSIYENDQSDQNVLYCPAISFDEVISFFLENGLINANTNLILRMNCEGSELAIINSLVTNNIRITAIFGSLYDVGKKHGEEAEKELNCVLENNEIKFHYFKGSDPGTWLNAVSAIDEIINNQA